MSSPLTQGYRVESSRKLSNVHKQVVTSQRINKNGGYTRSRKKRAWNLQKKLTLHLNMCLLVYNSLTHEQKLFL